MKLLCLLYLFFLAPLNKTTYLLFNQLKPAIIIHYLEHSSFLFIFDTGNSILTDYGASNSYGLISPDYEIDHFNPKIALFSHHDRDHDRIAGFSEAVISDGNDYSSSGVEIKAFPVTERKAKGTHAYFIIYKGISILFMGDCQGFYEKVSKPEHLQEILPGLKKTPDILMIPVGWTKDISKEAAQFAEVIDLGIVIPMHFWSGEEKEKYIVQSAGREIIAAGKPGYNIFSGGSVSKKKVVVLTPGSWKKKK